MPTALKQLQKMTVIFTDTGDAGLVRQNKPQDSTTNPSFVLAALNNGEAEDLISEEIEI